MPTVLCVPYSRRKGYSSRWARSAERTPGAAGPRVPDLDPLADVEPADAGGAEQGLVAGEGDDIQELLLHVNRDLARGLRGVDGKGDAGLAAVSPDLPDRLDGPDDVGGMVDDDQAGVRPEPLADLVGIDKARAVEGDVVDLDAVPREMVERPQHRVVLDGRR